ncbi:peptide ABC transporter permease [Alkalihalobacillus alcalophilus ATCC 27647 = CGMCC 1.3604]|uniref:Efflux transporter n=1 Tax=Alkalihalobacillus alcalophilus ATCC 27647 = CGMCC 1.3604 TaxID=1218173 RepID=J8TPY2_ALKAL|nr:ABC transporter permease [Alkalihalobacillus alcalophilus]AFV25606.1 efflux transporter [Alkalihalobacillus alcalophilus ATCC 27647 = CGMCC 1.3604]KGA97657.1 peptide ABC transporter permease [Alkalihalobacillus alcalophilus ATCC 27647 = CGMCC 1.3604]MED1561308.1 ABC transporter permease [Alkalihalobacillus alcalophilus]THG91470.1 peptide ABC transporter permease [Alkalihalobacillus alcalophilus ATCC 27647 = CGMCC 1.3604]
MFENIKLSFQSIFAHKLRSLLTMLGVIIGIAAVIAIVSIIEGQSEALKSDLVGMGNNTINVVYEENNQYGEDDYWGSDMSFISAPPISEETLEMIQSDPLVNVVSTYHQSWSGEAFHLANSSWPEMYGVDQTYLELFPITVVEGREFTDEEFNGKYQYVMINEEARDELFPEGFIPGSFIDLAGSPFRVIGVFTDRAEDVNDEYSYYYWYPPKVYVPKQIWPLVGGYDAPTQIAVQAINSDSIQTAGMMAADLLNADLHPVDAELASYTVMNLERIMEEMAAYTRTFAFLLAGIASISLLVGGIGVMNIMLVSVTERTREIGIKKALGAKRHMILFQFLTEATVLTSIGGIFGIGLGIGIAKLISTFTMLPFMISVPAIIGGLVFSMIVGILFGILPSLKASKLQPVDALRYE